MFGLHQGILRAYGRGGLPRDSFDNSLTRPSTTNQSWRFPGNLKPFLEPLQRISSCCFIPVVA